MNCRSRAWRRPSSATRRVLFGQKTRVDQHPEPGGDLRKNRRRLDLRNRRGIRESAGDRASEGASERGSERAEIDARGCNAGDEAKLTNIRSDRRLTTACRGRSAPTPRRCKWGPAPPMLSPPLVARLRLASTPRSSSSLVTPTTSR